MVHCIGSRFANVHVGLKKAVKGGYATTVEALKQAPSDDVGFEKLRAGLGNVYVEPGWVGEETIRRHGFSPDQCARTMVCGLPGVYDLFCGPRHVEEVPRDTTILGRLGWTKENVVKF